MPVPYTIRRKGSICMVACMWQITSSANSHEAETDMETHTMRNINSRNRTLSRVVHNLAKFQIKESTYSLPSIIQ